MMKSILKTVQKMITNNWALKLLAVLVAAIIWLAVINVSDPTKIVTIKNIPIEMINEEAITDNGQVYNVTSRQLVDVTITGRRSVVRDLSSSNFEAVASLRDLSVTNSVPVTVTLKNKNLLNKISISKQSVTQINVDVENVIEKNYKIDAFAIGKLDNGYELGNLTTANTKITISAPESIHDRIDSVVVNVDVTGATEDFSEKCKVIMKDKQGKKIDENNEISLSNKKVKVSVQILKITTVPIVVETKGNPASGYEVVNISTAPDAVTLAGPASIINEIKEIKISGDAADITGINENVEKKLDLIDYLVSGVTIRGDSKLKLNINVEGDIYKNYTYKASDISVQDVPDGYEAEILSDNISVSIYGKEDAFEGVTKESFNPSVSLKGVKEGKNVVALNITVPDGLEVSKNADVRIRLTQINKNK